MYVAEDSSQNIEDPSFSQVFVGCPKEGGQRRTIFEKKIDCHSDNSARPFLCLVENAGLVHCHISPS